MKKLLLLATLLLPTVSYAQVPDLSGLEAVQTRNDDMRDMALRQQQENIAAEQRREESRRNEIARSVAARNRAQASAIYAHQKYISENNQIDLEERKLKLQHDRVRSSHDEEFVKGELERQRAINNQINNGKVDLHVGTVDAD